MKNFEDYSEEHVNFHEPNIISYLIRKAIKISKREKSKILPGDIDFYNVEVLAKTN